MEVNSGLYFVGRCTSPTCTFYNALTTLYIGRGKTFDFVKERRQCMCGQCFATISDILHVFFFRCDWSYSGQLVTDEVLSEARQTQSIDYFPLEKQQLSWKWLKFTVSPDSKKLHKSTQTDSLSVSKATQTEPNSRNFVAENELVASLLDQAKRYRDKYHALKDTLKRVKTE